MSRSYGQLLALEALDDLALGVDRLDVEERVELDPLLLEDRVAISDTLSIVNARPIGEQKWISLVSRRPRSRSSASIRNATSSGAGGHL